MGLLTFKNNKEYTNIELWFLSHYSLFPQQNFYASWDHNEVKFNTKNIHICAYYIGMFGCCCALTVLDLHIWQLW